MVEEGAPCEEEVENASVTPGATTLALCVPLQYLFVLFTRASSFYKQTLVYDVQHAHAAGVLY